MTVESATKILQKIIKDKSGVIIDDGNPLFLQARLHSFLHFHHISNLDQLVHHLSQNPLHLEEVIDLVTTHESFFFRDDQFFNTLREIVLPNFYQTRHFEKRLRIWSAACAYGQEPYSLAMMFHDHPLNFSDWDIQIISSDISKAALKKASDGIFTHFEVQRGITSQNLTTHFEQVPKGWMIKSAISEKVKFENINLIEPFSHLGKFDIVLIRNVLIYFDDPTRRKILTDIKKLLVPDGYLGLGAQESVSGLVDEFETMPGIYCPIYRHGGFHVS